MRLMALAICMSASQLSMRTYTEFCLSKTTKKTVLPDCEARTHGLNSKSVVLTI